MANMYIYTLVSLAILLHVHTHPNSGPAAKMRPRPNNQMFLQSAQTQDQ